ncbi:MAG TPA: uroporphyrinogen-III synthase [Casimicrobiaceae bacterium]
MRRVLVLRPEPGASATIEQARKRGIEAIAVPLFEVEPLAWIAPDPAQFDGVLLTSANAARLGGDGLQELRTLPVYAVGEATAQAAREAGFAIAATGQRGVEQLLDAIESQLRLLHLCGVDRQPPRDAQQHITNIPVYRANPILQPDLGATEGSVALIHSPRAGRRFAELAGDKAGVTIAAISPAAAEAAGSGWQCVEVADVPSDDALLALAARLCNKPVAQ